MQGEDPRFFNSSVHDAGCTRESDTANWTPPHPTELPDISSGIKGALQLRVGGRI